MFSVKNIILHETSRHAVIKLAPSLNVPPVETYIYIFMYYYGTNSIHKIDIKSHHDEHIIAVCQIICDTLRDHAKAPYIQTLDEYSMDLIHTYKEAKVKYQIVLPTSTTAI